MLGDSFVFFARFRDLRDPNPLLQTLQTAYIPIAWIWRLNTTLQQVQTAAEHVPTCFRYQAANSLAAYSRPTVHDSTNQPGPLDGRGTHTRLLAADETTTGHRFPFALFARFRVFRGPNHLPPTWTRPPPCGTMPPTRLVALMALMAQWHTGDRYGY